MQVGDVVIVGKGAPARFKNLKPGTLWKVVGLGGRTGAGVTVGDARHPGINTDPAYLIVLDDFTKDQIRNTGVIEASNLSSRLGMVEEFKPELKSRNPGYGFVRIKTNGVRVHFSRNVAEALAAKGSEKLVQAKLIQKLGGF